MLLSIVMMIKNEEKYLNKTLKALEPLMNDIESELIILDTGSTDNSIEIAKRYTNKIYFARWNNNFSEMRNISIGHAIGEWILILDADEELLDYKELKRFFEENLHKKYNCAPIELKNIYREDESDYNLGSIYRLFRNKDNFRYEGAIHEQPIYKLPAYKNVALFKHYGYVFINEEIKQVKNNRNLKILIEEIKNEPNNPYINYQLGKTYMILNQNEDALFYMKRAYEIYKNLDILPAYMVCDLANLYINKREFEKCEKMCIKHIKYDSKNIDIYYYLAISQKQLGKYEKCLKSYEKYLYYINNYSLSTQANDIYCSCNTISYDKRSRNDIIFIYYKLGLYEEVMNKVKEMEFEELKEVYSIVFIVLCKLNKSYKIVELYNEETDKRRFRRELELSLNNLKEDEKSILYKLLSNIDDNYGKLNKLRIEKIRCTEDYKKILEEEIEEYYSEIIYYALKEGISIENMMNNLSYLKIEKFVNYLIINKRDCILALYEYLYNVENTLDIKKIHIYSCLTKGLLTYGNLFDEKYEMLFFMHIRYRYECIKSSYNTELSDKELLEYLNNQDDYFVVKINNINKLYEFNKLEYLRELKLILKENTQCKKGIHLFIDRFQLEFNESDELKKLRVKYLSIIENNIENNNIAIAENLIKEYEDIFKNSNNSNINIIKGVINLYTNNLDEAENCFKLAYYKLGYDDDLFFNIGYLKQQKGELKEANNFYNKIMENTSDYELKQVVWEKLQF